jgi:hypothetical protein
MVNKHYVGEIGTEILIEADSDISAASGVWMEVKKPDGITIEEWSATIVSGIYIQHIVEAGDFDQAGEYSVQPYIAMSGWAGYGETDTFKVHKKFC